MATIRVRCRSCPTTTLLSPEQVLLVCDGPAGPAQMLLLVAAGVPLGDERARPARSEWS